MSKSLEEKKVLWVNYAGRILLNTAAHPIEYAKVLMQIGYEPIPPRPCKTFFGKPALKLPNIFEYMKYIKKIDGVSGLYRGLVPKVCCNVVCAITTEKIARELDNQHSTENDTEILQENRREKFTADLKKELVSRAGAIIVSHPFHVISIRMMAQFVGNETKYNGLFNSFVEVYKQNGIMGFFSGIVPRLLGEMIFVVLASTLTYAVNSYIVDVTDLHTYTNSTMSFLASAVTYPFQVVSNCMIVSNSGLQAGMIPNMPFYPSWTDCWFDLSNRNQLKRGSSIIIRYYTGPQSLHKGKIYVINDILIVLIITELVTIPYGQMATLFYKIAEPIKRHSIITSHHVIDIVRDEETEGSK